MLNLFDLIIYAASIGAIEGDLSSVGLAHNWQIMFNEPATVIMLGIVDVHNQVFFYLIIIFVVVLWLFSYALYNSNKVAANSKNQLSFLNNALDFEHCTVLEVVWTVVPVFILIAIALPSLALLYSIDELSVAGLTLKVIGRQWYWSYEYPDFLENDNSSRGVSFDSNLLLLKKDTHKKLYEMGFPTPYLLTVRKWVALPINVPVRCIITSSDVLHSWAVPSFGIKTDACPGRLNQVIFTILRKGFYYGQCSELCGAGHGFMPIVVHAVDIDSFMAYINALQAYNDDRWLSYLGYVRLKGAFIETK